MNKVFKEEIETNSKRQSLSKFYLFILELNKNSTNKKEPEDWENFENNRKINKQFRKKNVRNDKVIDTFVRGIF